MSRRFHDLYERSARMAQRWSLLRERLNDIRDNALARFAQIDSRLDTHQAALLDHEQRINALENP